MDPIYYGLAVEAEEASSLAAVMTQQPSSFFVSSLSGTDEGRVGYLLNQEGVWGRLQSVEHLCSPLVRSITPLWPNEKEDALRLMASMPQSLAAWTCRNLLWQFATGGFLYWVTETNVRVQDLITHITVARMFNQTSIGVLPSSMRSVVETPTLTLTDHIVGEADPRALSLVLESLTRDTP